jgi:hypothetical protein
MKKVFLFFILLSTISCTDYPDVTITDTKLSYTINGENFTTTGYAQKYYDFKKSNLTKYTYLVYSLSPVLYIEAIDSTMEKTTFIYPEFTLKYNNLGDSNKHYEAISGRFTILENKSGKITGEFGGTMLNKFDSNDTLKIDNGSFEITLQTYKRVF